MLGPMKAKINVSYGSRWKIGSSRLACTNLSVPFHELTIPVYSLWQHPQIVPLLHTPDFVLQKLRTGSPLMTPGLARGPPFPSKAKENAIVAIASLETPTVPMVVGICEVDVSSLQQVQGAKGHAVRSEQWAGDEVWSWNPNGKPGGNAPAQLEGWDAKDSDENLPAALERLSVEGNEDDVDGGGVSLGGETEHKDNHGPHNGYVEGEDAEAFEKLCEEVRELTTKGGSSTSLRDV